MGTAFSFSAYLLSLPVEFIHWWFIESTFNLLKINRYILLQTYNFLGIKLLFRTFFKPWKNEYREGLVRFSLFMGIFIKSMLLVIYVFVFMGVILMEFVLLGLWVFFPFLVIGGLYAAIFA